MISVKKIGFNSYHKKQCDIEYNNGLPHYLLLITKASAWFYIDGVKINTEPYMVILFNKNTYIHYGCDNNNYNDDWLHFSIDEKSEPNFITSLDIPFNKPVYPPDIQRLSRFIQLATKEFHFPAKNSPFILDCLIKSFLYALSEDIVRFLSLVNTHKHYPAFLNLRKSIYNNASSSMTADKMATSLNLSISYFQHLYKQFFDTTPQMDVINSRLELAKFYLINSSMSIKSLSDFCGYDSDIHFMRQFKKFEGITPTQFRKNNYISNNQS